MPEVRVSAAAECPMSDQELFGQLIPQNSSTEFNSLAFIINQFIGKICTATLVEVKAISNAGGVAAVGTVDVQVLVNLMTGNRVAVPHGTISGIPYMRIQGGTNAVILDPQVGDIGICVFAMRDISAVIAAKGQANPGSYRQYDWQDGMYIGGVLNGIPAQYVQFSTSGINIVSSVEVKLQAPNVTLTGATTVTLNGLDWSSHTHISASSGSPTGPPL
jgi:hypothetical protein